MSKNTLYFTEIDKSSLPDVGGKGANLGELTRAGFRVPAGFCITTTAYQTLINTSSQIRELFELLGKLTVDKPREIRRAGELLRAHLLSLPIPEDVQADILTAWHKVGEDKAYAVRSSATAEDLPVASFAGQLESYLNVKGKEKLLQSVRKCWASLFTERAIVYRIKNGFSHQKVAISVVVQEMVFPEVSGIMFTADPVTGNRKVISIDASFGLGEAIVSGIVTADLYHVKKSGSIIDKHIAEKKLAIYPLPEGATITKELPLERQREQALSDDVILQLAQLGRDIELHYASPQDIEWAWAEGKLYIVQSRPITSLFPPPRPEVTDEKLRVFISLGHLQNMTDAMKPLGISVLRTIIPFGKRGDASSESAILLPSGARLFIDPTKLLRTRIGSRIGPTIFAQVDKMTGNALAEVIARDDFVKDELPSVKALWAAARDIPPLALMVISNMWLHDPQKGRAAAIGHIDNAVNELESRLPSLSGIERIRFIQQSMGMFFKYIARDVFSYAAAGIASQRLMERLLEKWLGSSRDQQYLNKSLPGSVTADMGLELGDIADLIRGNHALINYLKNADDTTFYSGLEDINGGNAFADAFRRFIQRYGMRCVGEIDITRPRWHEAPTQLVPMLISDIDTATPGEHRLRFKEGELEAEEATQRIIGQLKRARGSFYKVRILSRLIKVFRNLMAIREYPKYLAVRELDLYKQALLGEAKLLVDKGILRQTEDIFYLSLHEILEVFESHFHGTIPEIVDSRKTEYERSRGLVPPRVMTSDGEIVKGQQANVNAPAGALVGLPVSAGIVEGRARVIFKPEEAVLEPGDILVAPYTDPAWTPLFVSARGVVTEAGGLMTHGAVVAREYGIPAVVGIDGVTIRIRDGQRIRVNGDQGYVELL